MSDLPTHDSKQPDDLFAWRDPHAPLEEVAPSPAPPEPARPEPVNEPVRAKQAVNLRITLPPGVIPDGTRIQLPNLVELFAKVNETWFNNEVPAMPVGWTARLRSTAGRYMLRPPRIEIAARYHVLFPDELEDTMKHEMVHAWLHARGLPCGHTPLFHEKLNAIGATRYAQSHPALQTRRKRVRHVYQCPTCASKFFYKKRMRDISCGRCASHYDPRHVLVYRGVVDMTQHPSGG